jgi:hypothetical protein
MPADRETATFDYGVPAELFMGKRKGGPRQPLRYRRFATAAEAIRFAVEELPAVRALGAWMANTTLPAQEFGSRPSLATR